MNRFIGIRRVVGVFLALGLALRGMGQDSGVTMPLGDNRYELVPILMQDGNLAVRVSYYEYKPKTRLLYYSADGRLLWDKVVQNTYGLGTRRIKAVASQNGENIYAIEFSTNTDKYVDHYITRFDRAGNADNLVIDDGNLTSNLQAVFCDDQYLYYLTTLNGKEQRDNRKRDERLILNRFDLINNVSKAFTFDLPLIENGPATTFWTYVGQHGATKYLLSKRNDIEANQNWFDVARFDQDGTVLYTTRIELSLSPMHVRPAFAVSAPGSTFAPVVNPDLTEHVSEGDRLYSENSRMLLISEGPPVITYGLTQGSFTNLYLDEEHGFFYVYGLFGQGAFNPSHSTYDGFYIFKYALTGELIWKLEQPAPPDLLNHKDFRSRNARDQRYISLRVLPDETVNFSIQFSGLLFSHEISSEGAFVRGYKLAGYNDPVDGFIRDVLIDPQGELYAQQAANDLQRTHYRSFITPAGEILLEYDLDLNVYYFRTRK